VRLLPLDQVNLWEPFNHGIRLRLAAALAGGLVLLIAAINFVNLMWRSGAAEKEVGVRKAAAAAAGADAAIPGRGRGQGGHCRRDRGGAGGMAAAFVNAFLDTPCRAEME